MLHDHTVCNSQKCVYRCIYFKKTKTDSSTENLLFIEEYGFVSGSKIWTEDTGTNKNTAAKTYAHNLSPYWNPSSLQPAQQMCQMQLVNTERKVYLHSSGVRNLVQQLWHTVCTNYETVKENSTVKWKGLIGASIIFIFKTRTNRNTKSPVRVVWCWKTVTMRCSCMLDCQYVAPPGVWGVVKGEFRIHTGAGAIEAVARRGECMSQQDIYSWASFPESR